MGRYGPVEKEGPKADRLPKLTEGQYTLEVTTNKIINTNDGREAIIREFKILDSAGPNALPKGMDAAAKLLYLDAKWVSARIAEYVRGVTNAEKVTEELCDKIFGPKNPTKGKVVKCRVETAKSKANTDYSKYTWQYVSDDDAK